MAASKTRIEEDTLGPVEIPADALWGPQTQRSLENFPTGPCMPIAVIRALLIIKRAAAQANAAEGELSAEKSRLIVNAVDSVLELSDADLRGDFPLKVYQTGSGTQTNMNVNEVVAHRASALGGGVDILPNDDVNHSQSSNDVFPTAMNITAYRSVRQVEAATRHLIDELRQKEAAYRHTVKIGRTHLQDATPVTFGQEVSGWVAMLVHDLHYLEQLQGALLELPIGGTAVGTGLNANPHFARDVVAKLNEVYGAEFTTDTNRFAGLAAHSALNVVHGGLKTLAADLMKIANDVRFLASGPRAGYGELNIPANEPGSSIMPGKVNPTQAEAVTMVAVRVLGNDVVVAMAASQGNFEMNVYKPVLISAFLESADLLHGVILGFADRMIHGLTVNAARMRELVDNSLMTVTALSPHIGYRDSAKIAQAAHEAGASLREAALRSGKVTAEQFDRWVDPLKMTNIDRE